MKRILFLILVTTLSSAAAYAQNISVSATIDSNQKIYLGDRFALHIVLNGVQQAGNVDTSPLADFSPEYSGGRDYSRRQTTIINGKRTDKIDKQYLMTYSLAAYKSGPVRIPSLDVTADGKVYKTNPLRIDIIKPQESDKMELEVIFSKAKCYKGEPIGFQIKWLVEESIADAYRDAAFIVPVLRGENFYVEKITESQALKNKQGYVALKLNGQKAPFQNTGVKRNGSTWIEISYKAILIPKKSGKFNIDPALVLADFALGDVVQRGFWGSERENIRFSEKSDPAFIEVLDLPPDDGHNAFGGLVGKYTIETEASPVNVDVGQPIDLTIKIGGSAFLEPVQWPELENIEGFADNFKISSQREDPIIKDGQKIFKTVVRASTDKIDSIPPVPLRYFDTDKGEYITAESEPIPLDVSPSNIFTLDDAEIHGRKIRNHGVEAVKRGMAANLENIPLVNQNFSPAAALVKPAYLPIWAIPFSAFVLSVIIRTVTNTSEEKQAASRRRNARKRAFKILKSAVNKQDVTAAMKEYIGWRFNKHPGAITAIDCERLISENCGDDQTAGEYRKVFENCEAAYYTGGGKLEPEEIKKIKELINIIEKKSRH